MGQPRDRTRTLRRRADRRQVALRARERRQPRPNEVVIVQMKELRRVVTGIDAAGKSYVAIDGPPANIRESDGRGAAEFWITDATPADNRAPDDPAAERAPRLEPPAGGSVIRYFMVAPE